MEISFIVLIFILSYLIGSVSFAYIIGKIFFDIDLREHGSGNLGGTNAFRILGSGPGTMVIVFDMAKGTLAASLPFLFGLDINPLLVGAFALFGHSFSIFLSFKGGKAVATTAGIILSYEPSLFFSGLIFFFLFLSITKYVSLSSILVTVWALCYTLLFSIDDYWLLGTSIFLFLFITYRHRSNLKRIKEKKEPKVDIIQFLREKV